MNRALCVAVLGVVFTSMAVRAQSVEGTWQNHCASCHGKAGKGGGAGTRSLISDDLFSQDKDRAFFDAIRNGVPDTAMPAYGETMDDARIWGLVVHIRELQARGLRQEQGSPKPEGGVFTSAHHAYRLESVLEKGLVTPWAVDFLPDGRILFTERPGRVRVFVPGTKPELMPPLHGTPAVRDRGQGGMMEVAVHPDYAANGWVYLAFSDPQGEGGRRSMTKVVRGRIKGDRWTDEKTIFQAAPETYSGSDLHFGCRIAFGPSVNGRRHLYFCIGDRGSREKAQDLSEPNGKVHRLWDDGRVPDDNPFVATPGALKSVWSYGHRNPQGLTFDLDGSLWVTEHGPRGGDELNRVERARNYGWPTICFGIDYNDTPFRTPWPREGEDFTMPVLRWLPSIAACGLDVARGPMFPSWKGDLLAGGLAGEVLERVRVRGGVLIEREELIHGLGRVRDVACAPDGSIYVALNDPVRVVRLVEAGSNGNTGSK